MTAAVDFYGVTGGMAVLILAIIVAAVFLWGLNNLLDLIARRPR